MDPYGSLWGGGVEDLSKTMVALDFVLF